MKKVIVLSLGGSLIVPNEIDLKFLKEFRNVILKNTPKYKFVIVCGGGSVARTYIKALKSDGKKEYLQDLIGISVTRLNARFLAYLFGKDPEWGIPHDMDHIENLLKKNDVVFCGGLRYAPEQTSDTTAVRLAHYLKTDFVNLTNVKGLYDKNPSKFKDAKFIKKITIDGLNKIVMIIEQQPGMHAPVDHSAMKIIKLHGIKTTILGKDMKNFDNFLNGKQFVGSVIE
ncbi:UMP kinase [Candidatus Pacearchaeota archaeon]|nr:UMP kinase [Candidatus Pacearchaeota archaeon]